MLSQPFQNMLLNAVLKSLRCSSYVPTVTVALILIDDGALLNKTTDECLIVYCLLVK